MRGFVLCLVSVAAFAAPALARQDKVLAFAPEQPAQQKPATAPAPEKAETPRPTPTPGDSPQRPFPLANIRLEVTITDQRASGQPTTKIVALTLADRSSGRIRTNADVPYQLKGTGSFQYRSVMLNVDARPELIRDSRIRAEMTLEYRPTGSEPTNEEQSMTTISESFTVVLEDGKSLIVSQSADPNTDRRVRVELKATILK